MRGLKYAFGHMFRRHKWSWHPDSWEIMTSQCLTMLRKFPVVRTYLVGLWEKSFPVSEPPMHTQLVLGSSMRTMCFWAMTDVLCLSSVRFPVSNFAGTQPATPAVTGLCCLKEIRKKGRRKVNHSHQLLRLICLKTRGTGSSASSTHVLPWKCYCF